MSESIKNYCEQCEFDTNHKILSKITVNNDDPLSYSFTAEYMIVECLGCDNISFRKEYIDIESSYPDEYGNWIPDITITSYPKKEKVLQKLENCYLLPFKIKSIYDEAINAYNSGCFILTGIAFRAVIEAICLEENIPGNNLEKKINNLVKHKLITEKEAKRLHSIRFLGNDSVHEMIIPPEKSLKIVLSIINHSLNNLYLIDRDSEGILETVIDNYEDFERLLNNCLNNIKNEEEVPLAKILNKHIRRLNGRLNEFQEMLITKIKNNEYKSLAIGKIDVFGDNNIQKQHFIIVNNTGHNNPHL